MKLTRLKSLLIFLSGTAVGVGATYLCLTYRYSLGWFMGDTGTAGERPAAWAVRIDNPHLPNLHKVSQQLYRGAQPGKEGFRELEEMGVRTVVNLRLTASDRDELEGTTLAYEHIRAEPWDMDDEEAVRFLKIVTDKSRTPVFVHCTHGADRTGVMVAIYRVTVQGWSKQQAIEEMTRGGFGYHQIWDDLVEYIRQMDADAIRRRAGISD